MILSLFRKNTAREPVYAVYRAIVAQSRLPRYYAEWGVPDTVTGRFDMISLHLALLFRRLRGEGQAASAFAQEVFDLFFKDMDASLREMGAGDLAVPKKIQKMGGLFYGLLGSVAEALDSTELGAVRAAIVRNVYGGEEHPGAAELAAYLVGESDRLAAVPVTKIIGGSLKVGEAA